MEIFRHSFVTACKQVHVKPDTKVLSALESYESKSSLLLSTFNLDPKTCRALSRALSNDVHITLVDFSDCLLTEEGVIEIMKGLESNTSVTTLILKGNSIKGESAEAIGKLLRHNVHIEKLRLEWNSMGLLPGQFYTFCQALSVNSSLRELDLRNNQLNHHCAVSLCEALKRNITLEYLGLQWNNLGLLGGRAILNLLTQNKKLIRVLVEGNNIPLEIESGIETAVGNNAERQLIMYEKAEEARVLALKLTETENVKNEQVKILIEALKKKEEENSLIKKKCEAEISELKIQLTEKLSSIENLNSKVQELETMLRSSEKKVNTLSLSQAEMEKENAELRSQHKLLLSKERNENAEKITELQKKIHEQKDEIYSLHSVVDKFRKQEAEYEAHTERINSSVKKLKQQMKNSESQFQKEKDDLKAKHEDELKKEMLSREKDVSRLQAESEDMKKCFNQRLKNLEEQKTQLEMEISELKNQISQQKLQFEKQLVEEKADLKNQMSLIQSGLQKKEEILKENAAAANELQTKNLSLQLQIEEQNHEINKLRQAVQASEDDCKLQVAKIQLEVNEHIQELEKSHEKNKALMCEIQSFEQKIEEIRASHSEEIRSKDNEVQTLKDGHNARIQKLREEEIKRATDLQSAFMTYLNSVQTGT